MPIIEIQRMPGLPKERVVAPVGVVFCEWLDKQNLHADVRINLNGRELTDNDDVGFVLKESDRVAIFDQPKGGGFMKGSAIILGMFTYKQDIKFIGKVMSKLVAQPNASGAGNSKTSPNNSLKGQTNIARNGEARPDNFGLVRAFPDLIQESLFQYTDNLKYVTELMDFGLGKYDVSSIRYSESNLGAMAGSSYTIYQPGQVIPLITEGYQFDDVDGQEVPGRNESDDFPIETATANTVISGQYAGGQIAMKIVKQDDFDYFMDLTLPHPVTFTINVTYPVPGGTATEDIDVSGDLIAVSTTDDGAIINPVIYYNFTFNDLTGPDGVDVSTATINTTKFVLNDNGALIVGPVFSPVDSTELWIHTQSALGGKKQTNWSVTLWKVDADNNMVPGTQQVFTYQQTTPNKSSSETFYRTDKITPTGGYGRYAISFQRTDNSSDVSRLKVEAIHAVNKRTNVAYPDDTIVEVTVRSTKEATSGRERKYNALLGRHVISYNTTTQTVDYSLRYSRKFADIALFNWLVRGKQPEDTIDIYGLYQIQAEIDAIDPRLGYFDYTFDDEDVALGARMQMICDAASVSIFWDAGVLSFTRDKKQATPVTVFNRSNTVDTGYSLSYDMTLPGGFDGVELQYRNPTTNKQDFIRYRIANGSITSGAPTKAKKFEMMYIRDTFQANERALRECKRLIYSRMTMSITALADGEWVNVGQMVQVPDTYDTNQQAGYITARNGNDFDTSERINFSGNMFVVVTDSLGNPTARYPATQRSDTAFGFTAAIPNISLNIYDGFDVQSPSRYVIATSTELDATQWTITAKQPNGDGTTALTLEEYSDLIYP
ncbi:host specificity factor TipJ family phage tail protein [Scandinavium sp. TWS1a]|uniref:host specificity factor TipJ family phage tail protein n=1 Tax=Scandinavium tedordense TaxID=2926521 RepID=UPI002165F942|nr:host specificity factor TipJ family phage tail protein [Scandinavium tedordense]MCS2172811.1 host specificity factor TipJ family phage tail protein [Scandinavium tedordense]